MTVARAQLQAAQALVDGASADADLSQKLEANDLPGAMAGYDKAHAL